MSEFLIQAMPTITAGVGVYAAIRADLAALKARVDTLEKATDRAHARIDEFKK